MSTPLHFHTNIAPSEGIQTTSELLAVHRVPNNLQLNSYIIDLIRLVLENNNFEFNGENYNQMAGTVMGTKLAPFYANIFMSHWGKIGLLPTKSTLTMEGVHRQYISYFDSWYG